MSVYTTPKSSVWQFDFWRGGKRFFGSFDGQEGRPQIRAVRPKREAERAEAVLKSQAGQPVTTRSRITLDDASTRYWKEEAQHFSGHLGERGRIKNLKRLIGKFVFVDEIDSLVISRFVATRRRERARNKKTAVSNATVNREVECLARIFKRVKKWKCRLPEDLPEWHEHKLREPRQRIRSLTSTEQTALFSAIDSLRPDFRDFIEFALLTSKRLSEVYLLEKAKVDRRAMTAIVRQKGGGDIVIALTARTLDIIQRNWMHHTKRVFTYVSRANKTYTVRGKIVAIRKGDRRPFTKNGWRQSWKEILEKAEIKNFRFHDLRHTALTRILAATGNLRAVQDAAGHASIVSSARYAHTNPRQRRAALEAAEKFELDPEE